MRSSDPTQSKRQPKRPLSTPSTPPDHVGLLGGAVVLMGIGWGGLYWLVTTQYPRIGGELWLFFVLLQIAVSSTALPIVRYLNVRFTPLDVEVPPSGVIIRQSVWVGLFVVTNAWLMIPRYGSLAIALFIGVIIVIIESFLRSRERTNDDD